jgi:hypothetical protein
MERRSSVGFTTLASAAGANGGTMPTRNIYALAFNQDGSIGSPSDYRAGSYAVHTGMTSAQSTAYSLAIKTLWEECSGLSLP